MTSEYGDLITFYDIIYHNSADSIKKRFQYKILCGIKFQKILKIKGYPTSVIAIFSDNSVRRINIYK